MEGDQNVVGLSKERSAKLVKTWPYVVARYAHATLARDHVRLCNTTKTTHFQHYRACPSTVYKEELEEVKKEEKKNENSILKEENLFFIEEN